MPRHHLRTLAASVAAGLTISLALLATPAAADSDWYKGLVAKAEAGDTASQLEVGNILIGNAFPNGDMQPGMAWITRAANAGDAAAQYRLGWLYDTGRFFKADDEQGMAWYRKASASGNGEASGAIAVHYDLGKGVTKDNAEATRWYEIAAGQGNTDAALEVGRRYTSGLGGVPRDRARAMHFFDMAGPKNTVQVAREVCAGNSDPTGSDEDWARALPYCRKLDAEADAIGLYGMGMAYAYGRSLTRDGPQALDYLTRAAASNLDEARRDAMAALGDIHFAGTLGPADPVQALDWRRKAVKAGSQPARVALAQQYENGQGTPVDLAAAARLYEIITHAYAQERAAVATAWFRAHPQFSAETLRAEIIPLGKLPRNLIFYDVPPNPLREKEGKPTPSPVDLIDYLGLIGGDYYPPRALDDEVEGVAAMECRISPAGQFTDCVQTREQPVSYGFSRSLGAMIDKLSQSRNKAEWVSKYAGKTVSVSFYFRLGK